MELLEWGWVVESGVGVVVVESQSDGRRHAYRVFIELLVWVMEWCRGAGTKKPAMAWSRRAGKAAVLALNALEASPAQHRRVIGRRTECQLILRGVCRREIRHASHSTKRHFPAMTGLPAMWHGSRPLCRR